MKRTPVRVGTGVNVCCKDMYLDPEAFFMAEICLTEDKYPKYFIKLSHKYIPGCCMSVGSFLTDMQAQDWLVNFLEKKDA